MSELRLKSILGVPLVVSHFLAVVLLFVIRLVNAFTIAEEFWTALALIGPMFAAHTSLIISSIVVNRRNRCGSSAKVGWQFAFLGLFIAVAFIICLYGAIILFWLKIGLRSFEQFKNTLGVIEAVFGVYLGVFVRALFGKNTTLQSASMTSPGMERGPHKGSPGPG